MGNHWIKTLDINEFNRTLKLYAQSKHAGDFTTDFRKEVYEQILLLAEELMQYKKPESDLKPYLLARACFTPYKPIKEWPNHWHDKKHGAWVENDFLEKNEVTDKCPLDSFDPKVCKAFYWFASTMFGCMREMDALIPMNLNDL